MPAVDVWFADTQSPRGVWAIQLQVNAHCSYVMCTSNSKRKRIKIHEVAGHEAGSSLPAFYSYSPTNRMYLEVGLNHYLDLLGCEFETSTVQGLNALVFPLSTWTLNVPQDQQHFGHRTLFFYFAAEIPVGLGNKIKYVRAAIRGLPISISRPDFRSFYVCFTGEVEAPAHTYLTRDKDVGRGLAF